MTRKSFFVNGLPPLGGRTGTRSKSSVSKEHEAATISDATFHVFDDAILCQRDAVRIWGDMDEGDVLKWGRESDIQGHVKEVLKAAIQTVGLKNKVECSNELSIFDVRPDVLLIFRVDGVPIGVVKVKQPPDPPVVEKPDKKGDDVETPADDDDYEPLMDISVQGQLFDYMLRLKSFFGLRDVFGILTTYEKWRFCWFPGSDQAAALGTESQAQQAAGHLETGNRAQQAAGHPDTENQAQPARQLHGSKLLNWDNPFLVRVLCTAILKMYQSPRLKVALIDKKRPYIWIDAEKWFWKPIRFQDESSLSHAILPKANTFILLMDLRDGTDGRVWRACTPNGVGCCIKFPKLNGVEEPRKQVKSEVACWDKAYGKRKYAVAKTLSGQPALIMRYLFPLELHRGRLSQADEAGVRDAVKKFSEQGLQHLDLAVRHLGRLSPSKKEDVAMSGKPCKVSDIILFDLGRVKKVEDKDKEAAYAKMMAEIEKDLKRLQSLDHAESGADAESGGDRESGGGRKRGVGSLEVSGDRKPAGVNTPADSKKSRNT